MFDKIINNRIAYHSLFWLLVVIILSLEDLAHHYHWKQNLRANITIIILFAPAIYFNLYYVIPKFLLKRKYIIYGAISLGLLLASTYIISLFFANIYNRVFYATFQGFMVILADCLMIMLLTTAINFIRNLHEEQKKIKDLQQKNLEIEVQLLRNQVNPHMFFNTLNNIYFLIDTNSTLAKKTILQFTDLLSHQLYDNKKDKIELKKEIEYIGNFIELEKLRQGDIVKVTVQLPHQHGGGKISPMLLLPFVENAFKHGDKTASSGYFVNISIRKENNNLVFICSNSFSENKKQPGKGGLGLENIKRRLDLLYPGQYSLSTNKNNSEYTVKLKIPLDEN